MNGGRPRWLGRNSAPWSGQSCTGATIRCRDQAASDVLRAAAARGCAGPGINDPQAGRPLAEGEARHRQYPEAVCRRIEGEDPRFWVLVAMHTPPPRLTFVASDLRISKNLNWRTR